MARILIVENDRITAWALQRAVTRMGHLVVARTFSAAEAMAVVQADRPEVVLLDIGLRELQDGLLVGLDIQTFWSTPVIYLSGSDPAELGLQEFPEALWCYIAKPIDQVQLHDTLAQLFPPPRGFEGEVFHKALICIVSVPDTTPGSPAASQAASGRAICSPQGSSSHAGTTGQGSGTKRPSGHGSWRSKATNRATQP